MNIRLRIARSSGQGGKPFSDFQVTLEGRMTVLDALFHIQRELDSSLGFRCACRVGMCGTCAVSVNRVPRLACSTLVRSLNSDTVTVEPLPNLPVIKDLAVSLAPFFEQWKHALPAFRPRDRQSQELARIPANTLFAETAPGKRDCITCGACYSACTITHMSRKYLGPAAINRALLRLLDPRDAGDTERLAVLDKEIEGVWRCHTQFNCTATCPRGISLTDSIVRIKRALLRRGRIFQA
jgi:succinate dehydrogenase iron-sulfur subunit